MNLEILHLLLRSFLQEILHVIRLNESRDLHESIRTQRLNELIQEINGVNQENMADLNDNVNVISITFHAKLE